MNPVDQLKRERIANALAVHDRLMEWADGFSEGSQPVPNVTIAGYYVSLSMGDMEIWNSEGGYYDEQEHGGDLNYEGAVECYKNLVADMAAWPREETRP